MDRERLKYLIAKVGEVDATVELGIHARKIIPALQAELALAGQVVEAARGLCVEVAERRIWHWLNLSPEQRTRLQQIADALAAYDALATPDAKEKS